jgi:7-cyano-7-deazaguanine synthase
MDSICLAYWRRPELAITINYGQRAAAGEIRAARAVCAALNIEHCVIDADIAALGSGDMVGSAPSQFAPATEWWPYRNQFIVTLAAMKCHQAQVNELMVGALRTDGFHVDSTERFFLQLNALMKMQEGHFEITTPAIGLSATELIQVSAIPEEILAWSHSCHVNDVACGFCRGCQKHFETTGAIFGRSY